MKKPPLLERLRAKKDSGQSGVVGVCWYTEAGWARVKETATDRESFEDSYDERLAVAEKAFRDLSQSGLSLVKVIVDPDEFGAWCRRYGKKNNGSTRTRYVTYRLRRAKKQTPGGAHSRGPVANGSARR